MILGLLVYIESMMLLCININDFTNTVTLATFYIHVYDSREIEPKINKKTSRNLFFLRDENARQ